MTTFLDTWVRCSPRQVCPICGRKKFCAVSKDGKSAICTQAESKSVYKTKSGDAMGWIHRIGTQVEPPKPVERPVEPPKNARELYEMALQCHSNLKHPELLSRELGVSAESLKRLFVGWDGRNYTFPMSNGHDVIIGIRLRSQHGKYSVPGSKNGLFIPDGLGTPKDDLLLICEGPTDCAALLDLHFDAIGRASCNTGGEYLLQLLSKKRRPVVIVADNDVDLVHCRQCNKPAKETEWDDEKCPHCGAVDNGNKRTNPGWDGARALANQIKAKCRSLRIIAPPEIGTDIRSWYRAGATTAEIAILISNARFL